MIKEAINKVVSRKDLAEEEMKEVMREMMTGIASADQISSFITGLRMKGETVEEITAAARVIKERVSDVWGDFGGEDLVSLDREEITIERETILTTTSSLLEGTTIFNVSTATALVVAGGGLKVSRYVARSAPPVCGCADVVEELGIRLDMTSTQLERCLREVGICFLHESLVKNGLERLMEVRRRIGIRTIFNLLDPLINPAKAKVQVLGVYDPSMTEKMAMVLKSLGIKKGFVLHGEDTLDEISLTGRTKITEFDEKKMRSYFINPEDFGMKRRRLDEIKGGTGKENAEIIVEILRGSPGAKRDITLLNAAACFVIAGKAKGFDEGIGLANHSIDSGEALKTFERLKKFTDSEGTYLRDGIDVDQDFYPQSFRSPMTLKGSL